MNFKLKLYFIFLVLGSNIFADWEMEEANKGKIVQVNAPETWRTFKNRNELGLISLYNRTIKLAYDRNLTPNIRGILLAIETHILKTKKLGNILKSRRMIHEVEQIASKWLTQEELATIYQQATANAKN